MCVVSRWCHSSTWKECRQGQDHQLRWGRRGAISSSGPGRGGSVSFSLHTVDSTCCFISCAHFLFVQCEHSCSGIIDLLIMQYSSFSIHLRNIWRHISSTWPFPHRYRHAWWPVDVMELFPRFCCWTLIRLSHHWAWLCWGYWHYSSLIDWLIDWFGPGTRRVTQLRLCLIKLNTVFAHYCPSIRNTFSLSAGVPYLYCRVRDGMLHSLEGVLPQGITNNIPI